MNNKELIVDLITRIVKDHSPYGYNFGLKGVKLNGCICYDITWIDEEDKIVLDVMGTNSSWLYNNPITEYDYNDLKKILQALVEML